MAKIRQENVEDNRDVFVLSLRQAPYIDLFHFVLTKLILNVAELSQHSRSRALFCSNQSMYPADICASMQSLFYAPILTKSKTDIFQLYKKSLCYQYFMTVIKHITSRMTGQVNLPVNTFPNCASQILTQIKNDLFILSKVLGRCSTTEFVTFPE